MAKAKTNKLEKWLADNKANVLGLIKNHNAEGDQVLYYAIARTYPSALLTWIPIVGMFLLRDVKVYLLAVTRKNFLMIRLKPGTIEESAFQSVPIGTITESTIETIKEFSNLKLVLTDGKKLAFNDMLNDWATLIKRAINTAQAKPAEVQKKLKTKSKPAA
jgi:hypothetical protein